MMRKCGKKKLTRLALTAFLSTGGVLFSISPTVSAGSSGNNITISGGTINENVYGGQTGDEGGIASNNTITITGGTFGTAPWGDPYGVYGGMAPNGGTASNNTVNILAKIIVGDIQGGDASISENNTLNIGAVGVQTKILGSFQNINFFLPATTKAGDTMLTVEGDTNVTGVTFGVAAQKGLTSLVKDDKVTLLKSGGTLTSDATLKTTTKLNVPTGITTSDNYEFEITKSGTDSIIATVTKAEASSDVEVAKSLVETRAATTTFVNAGADMLASQGFAQAANAVALDAAESKQDSAAADGKQTGVSAPSAGAFTPFAAFGGSSLRAESGSYVDTKGFGLNIGFAREVSNSQGKLLFGPLVEYGGGNYDSYLDDGTHGEGGSHYWGIGIMARQVNHDGFYYEGSVRGGRVTSDYKSHLNNQDVSYDSASNYWAAHLGLGKVFEVGGNNTVDGYFKYFYSHQGGDDVTIHGSVSGDEQWNFDGVNSNRIRIGARLTHKVNEMNSFYGGLAYQYEFGGEARAHYNGGTTPSPSVKGSSGMLELGWQVKPGGPLTLDLGVTGWAGKQRGGSVQLGATWTF